MTDFVHALPVAFVAVCMVASLGIILFEAVMAAVTHRQDKRQGVAR